MVNKDKKPRIEALYKVGDEVEFLCCGSQTKQPLLKVSGIICVVDCFGVFEDDSQPYYDINDYSGKVTYKHVPQDRIVEKKNK